MSGHLSAGYRCFRYSPAESASHPAHQLPDPIWNNWGYFSASLILPFSDIFRRSELRIAARTAHAAFINPETGIQSLPDRTEVAAWLRIKSFLCIANARRSSGQRIPQHIAARAHCPQKAKISGSWRRTAAQRHRHQTPIHVTIFEHLIKRATIVKRIARRARNILKRIANENRRHIAGRRRVGRDGLRGHLDIVTAKEMRSEIS